MDTITAIAYKHYLSRGGSLQGAIARLQHKGLIYGSEQGYWLALPLLYQVAFIRSTFIFSVSPCPRVPVSVSTTMFERNCVLVLWIRRAFGLTKDKCLYYFCQPPLVSYFLKLSPKEKPPVTINYATNGCQQKPPQSINSQIKQRHV